MNHLHCLTGLGVLLAGAPAEATALEARPPDPVPRYTSWLIGDSADVTTPAQPGLLLAGGSTDVDEAMRWFLQRSGGGDVVVIRASGSDGYNRYLFSELGEKVNSVETILIDNRAIARDPDVARKLRNAEALFIAGGDQANYVNFWKDTPVEDAINFLLNHKRVPVGGTSAGCGILSGLFFDALLDTVDSPTALSNPYNPKVSLQNGGFLEAPFLKNTFTDMHFSERRRLGRLVTFLARAVHDWHLTNVRGIGVDEKTALAVDETGTARVLGRGNVYLLETLTGPARCEAGKPLDWPGAEGRALKATVLSPNEPFNLKTWTGGGKTAFYAVRNGELRAL
jgi:cyanophycinase